MTAPMSDDLAPAEWTWTGADPHRPAQAPESAQEPQTPAPGSSSTPETLSGRLSAPDRGTA